MKHIDEKLVPAAGNGDSKVFYLKMKGDYHRHLVGFNTGDDRKVAVENTITAYKSAQVGGHFSNFLFDPVHLFALIWFNFRVLLILNVNYNEYIFNFFESALCLTVTSFDLGQSSLLFYIYSYMEMTTLKHIRINPLRARMSMRLQTQPSRK